MARFAAIGAIAVPAALVLAAALLAPKGTGWLGIPPRIWWLFACAPATSLWLFACRWGGR